MLNSVVIVNGQVILVQVWMVSVQAEHLVSHDAVLKALRKEVPRYVGAVERLFR